MASDWAARGYYGTLSHNAKAVYQFYLGWYNANPADLNPLPRAESARKQIEYMGGAEAVLKRAREDFKAGQYRWVAEIASQLVFADPANKEARELGADALEQLGYQSEAATWRNAYLLGAAELRNGVPRLPAVLSQCRTFEGHHHRSRLRFPRRAAQCDQGRRQAHRHQLEFHRPQNRSM